MTFTAHTDASTPAARRAREAAEDAPSTVGILDLTAVELPSALDRLDQTLETLRARLDPFLRLPDAEVTAHVPQGESAPSGDSEVAIRIGQSITGVHRLADRVDDLIRLLNR